MDYELFLWQCSNYFNRMAQNPIVWNNPSTFFKCWLILRYRKKINQYRKSNACSDLRHIYDNKKILTISKISSHSFYLFGFSAAISEHQIWITQYSFIRSPIQIFKESNFGLPKLRIIKGSKNRVRTVPRFQKLYR